MKIQIMIVVALIVLPMVSAIQIDGSSYIAEDVNLTLNTTTDSSLYVNYMAISLKAIYLEGFTDNNLNNDSITINLTEANVTYTGSQLPLFTSTSNSKKTIGSDITKLNLTVNAFVPSCDNFYWGNYSSAGGEQVLTFDSDYLEDRCVGNVVTLENITIEDDNGVGNNILNLNYTKSTDAILIIDLEDNFTRNFIILLIILIVVMIFFKLFLFAGIGLFIIGASLLMSGFSAIFSFLLVVAGLVVATATK